MTDHVYSITEIIGTSSSTIEDAIQKAVATASKTLRNIEWCKVEDIRAHIENGQVAHYQVALKLGFRYEK